MDTGNLLIDAQAAFARQRRGRHRDGAVRWLTRRPREATLLGCFDDAVRALPLASRRSVGLRTIPLASIVGTAECSKRGAFDRRFRPPETSRHRWERLWIAARRGKALPPIAVYRVGDEHFVADGHHRVSVANALGMSAIDAEVTEIGLPARAAA